MPPTGLPCHNVRDFGATGDGVTLDTAAINRTLASCHAAGGGTVFVPAGVYLVGTLDLLSNVTLHLDAGSVIKGSPNLADYRVLPYTSEFRNTTLILADGARNIAITGRGTIDGNGVAFGVFDQADKYRDFAANCTRQGEAYFAINDLPDDGPVVHKPRPGMLILLLSCRDIHVSNIKIVDAPNWCLHLARCEDALLTGLECKCSLLLPNSDCVDVSLCRNVRISDCNFEAGDDGIAFSPCADGFGDGIEENITVENCIISSRSCGIRLGWGEHNFRNLYFNNLIIRNSNRGIGLFLRRGETIENVVFSNIFIETRLYKGKWWGKAEPIHISSSPDLTPEKRPGCIRNVSFNHITIESEHGIVIANGDGSVFENISFNDMRIAIKPGPLQESFGGNFDLRPAYDASMRVFRHDIPAIYAKGVKALTLRDVEVEWRGELPAFFSEAVEIEDFEDVTIDGFRGRQAHSGPVISLRRGRVATVRNCALKRGAGPLLAAADVTELVQEPARLL